MELIERYVQEVGRALPRTQRADIELELRSLLIDSFESRVNEGNYTAIEVEIAILEEFGPPDEMARSYAVIPNWVIGPRWYSGFLSALKIIAILALLAWIQAVVGIADWSGGWHTFLPSISFISVQILTGYFTFIGILTLSFAALERVLDRPQPHNSTGYIRFPHYQRCR